MAENMELADFIQSLPWDKYLKYGIIAITIREGKATLLKVEETHKLD